MSAVLTLFYITLFLFFTQLVVAIFLLIISKKRKKLGEFNAEPISIIIPFRNESKRISHLINSLNVCEIDTTKIELILVDDHSIDDTKNVISNQLKCPHRIIELAEQSGKKSAIHAGVLIAKHERVVTLDADVEFGKNYIEALCKLPDADMIILPVKMTGDSFFQRLGSIEFHWLQVLTFGAVNPTLCNGANLVFKKKSYLSVYAERQDFEIASGDDLFLLKQFKKSKLKIVRLNEKDLLVSTPAPTNLKELLLQRKRWFGKMNTLLNLGTILLILFLLLLQIELVLCLTFVWSFSIFLIPIGCKFLAEFFASLIHAERKTIGATFFVVIAHQIWYPLYLLLLCVPIGKENKWRQH